ncbi:TfuA-like protein [Streptomyces murinus]|uniref:TfuA-like protein n=1 Tax=Streptomyces murinus TaxID=33900 RepID=UPI0036E12B11
MAVHVFVGPSCPEPEVVRNFPDVIPHRPVRHGDLFSDGIKQGDVVVILDGVYHHQLALRHKEILDAIDRDVILVGAASIGALRAVELESHGMIGVGQVFRWYREGIFDGDDAVSVAHGDSGSLVGLNIPLVNLYSAMIIAHAEEVIDAEQMRHLLELFEAVYYPLRSAEHVVSIAGENGASRFAKWFRSWWEKDPARFDQKRRDSLAAIAHAEALATSPSSRRAVGERTDGRDWRTEYHRRWRSRFHASEGILTSYQRVAYQQIFNSSFPQIWWSYVELGPGRADPVLANHVLTELGQGAVEWLSNPRLAARITTLFCPTPDLASPEQRAILLRGETADDQVTATRWLTSTREHLDRRPGHSLSRIAESTCTAVLSRIWFPQSGSVGMQRVQEESARRGFVSLRHAAVALRPFIIGYLADLSISSGSPDSRKRDHVAPS